MPFLKYKVKNLPDSIMLSMLSFALYHIYKFVLKKNVIYDFSKSREF